MLFITKQFYLNIILFIDTIILNININFLVINISAIKHTILFTQFITKIFNQ